MRKKILQAFERYRKTGEEVLEQCSESSLDSCVALLHDREQIFKSITKLDSQALSEYGFDMGKDPACIKAWLTSQEINRTLEAKLGEALSTLASRLKKSSMNQRHIGAYKSQQTSQHKLFRTV